MKYSVYVLYSKKHNKIYIGYTSDLQDRFRSHNELATKGYTEKYRPWITALSAMLLIMFLFAASHALERTIDPSISPESKTQFHLARDLGVSFVVALLIVFVSEWRMRQVEDNLEKRERHVAEVLKE